MKEFVLKKDEANIFSLFSVIIAAMVVMIMMVFYAGWMGNLDAKDRINATARQYLLLLETNGYLSQENINSLESELRRNGMVNINTDETTQRRANYGDTINLVIQGDLKITSYLIGNTGFFRLIGTETTIPITIQLSSTSKSR